MNKKILYSFSGILSIVALILSSCATTSSFDSEDQQPPQKDVTIPKKVNNNDLEIGKQLAKNMATGEIILMASCLGKQGAIPRDKMGDYISAAVEKQGITRQELFDNWDKYWGFAKEAEKRNRTSCLD
jgi:hypothetical protein